MKKKANFMVEEKDLEKLEELAVQKRKEHGTNLTISDLFREAISEFIAKHTKKGRSE
jgi:hypothetical protein